MLGSAVGPYEIVAKLGVGGMGEVFLGHDPRLQRRVALKCLTAAAAGGAGEHARVLREARAAARLNHPNIAAVYDVLEQDDRTFIVMEYVEGESLSARMARGRVGLDEVRAIGRQLASALASAHAHGVIHRDLKPANIQIAPDGSIKVLDFGVAKLSRPAAGTGVSTEAPMSEHTIAGNPGTPLYMSPEQIFSRPIDARSDLYSAGVILFQMATGRRPYEQADAVGLALAMSAGPAPPAQSINPEIPDDLNATMAKALEREPDERLQSARELEAALGAGTAIDAGGVRPPWTARAALAAALVVAAIAGVGWWLRAHQAPPPPSEVSSAARRVVAVLPLENLSGDREKDYLGAGVAETLTMALSKVPALTILSRREVRDALRSGRDPRSLARDLDVSFIVDGSVQQAGDRLRITLRTVRPEGTVAWSEAYEADAAAIFTLHRTMAADLVNQVQGRTTRPADLTLPSTTDVNALTAYWEGRSTLDRAVSPGDLGAALRSFRRAVALDPRFAPGYAGLADTLWQQYQVTHDTALPGQALDAGLTALRLDPNQPETRVAVATVYQGMGQYDAAIDQLRRALDLQPSNDDARRVLARVLSVQGKSEDAIAELQRALTSRPRRWANYNELGRLYYQLRRLPEAAATYQKALELFPDDARTLLSLGAVYFEMADLRRALETFERSQKIAPTGLALSNMGTTYYRLGRLDEAVAAFKAALGLDAKSPLLHGNLGDAYLRLHRTADARREFASARALALEALRVNDKDVRTLGRVARFEAKLGMARAAAAHALQAVALAPHDPDVQYKQAVVFALAGHRDNALQALKAALALGFKAADAVDDDDLAAIKASPEFAALVGNAR